ncbi:hypothetical protein C8F04DRAFT_1278324 [Mycena alexandri]|uniref:Uncharacterized protein n=1 Tax=Mycena alexandri TaxID=1745969 RepID=A0AAD6S046_9AGAR|nr:hypothetical protein C8F04DRAFT_1278324 [Mycena alexandri]
MSISTSLSTPTPTRGAACISARCSAVSKARPASKKCTQHFCKECCSTTSLRCQVSTHNQPLPTPSTLAALSFPATAASAGPYARMIAPEYAAKIAQKDFTLAPSTRVQTEAYRMETTNLIKVKYWVNDNDRAQIFSVPVPAFPYFHPKDCETITTKLGISCVSYDILDVTPHLLETTLEEEDEWITTSTATLVKPNTTLYMRLPTVQHCLGLRTRKRAISEVPDSPTQSLAPATPSPTKRLRSTPIAEEYGFQSDDTAFSSPNRVSVASSSSLPLTLNSPRGKRTAFPLAHSQENLTHARLKNIISAHTGKPFVGAAGPRNINTAVRKILQEKISVNWDYVLGSTTNKSASAVDTLFREYILEDLIFKPADIPTPSSTRPSTPMQVDEPATKPDKHKQMQVSVKNGADNKRPSSPDIMSNPENSEDEWVGILPLQVGTGSAFYTALEKRKAIDKDWTVALLFKDCTVIPQNPTTDFATGVNIPLQLHGPDGSINCLFVHATDVVSQLEDAEHFPGAPWDLFWCLPGFPWVVGPFARLHDDDDDVQMDSSQRMLREIPVTGPEDALRVMVIFKHPIDPDRSVPGLEELPEGVVSVVHGNGITPYTKDEIKPNQEEENNVKPNVSQGKVSAGTQMRNKEIVDFLLGYWLPLRPVLKDLHQTKATARLVRPIPQVVRWIDEIHYLRTEFPKIRPFMQGPTHLNGRKITDGHWKDIKPPSRYARYGTPKTSQIPSSSTPWECFVCRRFGGRARPFHDVILACALALALVCAAPVYLEPCRKKYWDNEFARGLHACVGTSARV